MKNTRIIGIVFWILLIGIFLYVNQEDHPGWLLPSPAGLVGLLLLVIYGVFWIVGNISFLVNRKKQRRLLTAIIINVPFVVIGIFLIIQYVNDQSWSYNYKVNIKVLDEQESGINDAIVLDVLHGNRYKTDDEGVVVIRGSVNANRFTHRPSIVFAAGKDGYYTSRTIFHSERMSSLWFFQKLEPYGPDITMMLKRIKNPSPMMTGNFRNVSMDAVTQVSQNTNEYTGYDLFVRDWVAPYGNGEIADLRFRVAKNKYGEEIMEIAFASKMDGAIQYDPPEASEKTGRIQTPLDRQSYLQLPRKAPDRGYVQRIYGTIDKNRRNGKYHIFRIRSQTDKTGKITTAHYGIFHGKIAAKRKVKDSITLSLSWFVNEIPNDQGLEYEGDVTKSLDPVHLKDHVYYDLASRWVDTPDGKLVAKPVFISAPWIGADEK